MNTHTYMSTDPVTSAHFLICIHQHTHTKLSPRSFASVDPRLLHGDLLQHSCKGTFLFVEQSERATNYLFIHLFFSFRSSQAFYFSPWPTFELRSCQFVYSAERKPLFSIYHIDSVSVVWENRAKQSQTFNEIYILKYMLTQS